MNIKQSEIFTALFLMHKVTFLWSYLTFMYRLAQLNVRK